MIESASPLSAATCSGVVPSRHLLLGLAPACKTRTQALEPDLKQAYLGLSLLSNEQMMQGSGLLLHALCHGKLADARPLPTCSSATMVGTWRQRVAWTRGLAPVTSLHAVVAPAASSSATASSCPAPAAIISCRGGMACKRQHTHHELGHTRRIIYYLLAMP